MNYFPQGLLVLDESNEDLWLGDGQSVVVDGLARPLARTPKPPGHDTRAYSRSFSDVFKTYPKSEWSARLKAQKERKACTSQIQTWKPDNQLSFPTCWSAGTMEAAATARVRMGLPHVYLSAMAIAVPISGGNSGGYEGDAVRYLMKYGGVEQRLWPNGDRHDHSDEPAIKENRKLYICTEAFELEQDADYATAWLMGFATTVAWNSWSHVTEGCDLDDSNGFGTVGRNQWGSWGSANEHGVDGYFVKNRFPDSGWAFRQFVAAI